MFVASASIMRCLRGAQSTRIRLFRELSRNFHEASHADGAVRTLPDEHRFDAEPGIRERARDQPGAKDRLKPSGIDRDAEARTDKADEGKGIGRFQHGLWLDAVRRKHLVETPAIGLPLRHFSKDQGQICQLRRFDLLVPRERVVRRHENTEPVDSNGEAVKLAVVERPDHMADVEAPI